MDESGLTTLLRLMPKTTDLAGLPGRAELSPSDIAAALSYGLPTHSYYAILAWVGVDCAKQMIQQILANNIMKLALKNKWISTDDDVRIPRLADLAVRETYQDPCTLCEGRAILWYPGENLPRICVQCNGRGRELLNKDLRRDVAKMTKREWKTWEPRYEYEIRARLLHWLADGAAHVREQLY